MLAEADGFCFLNAILIGLYLDHVLPIDRVHIRDAIIAEFMQNEEKYRGFSSSQNLFQDLVNYTQDGVYSNDIVDVMIPATANAINIVLNIYLKHTDGNTVISTYVPTTYKIHPPHEINVLYIVNSNNVHHCDAILKKKKKNKKNKLKLIQQF